MVSDSDPLPQLPSRPAVASLACPPENNRLPSLSEFGSKAVKGVDVKTLAAIRRRIEIRRLKLMAAAHVEPDAEPSPKRAKRVSNGLRGLNWHGASKVDPQRGCELHDPTGACISSADADTTNAVASVSAPQEQGTNKDKGDAGLRSRLTVSGHDKAFPSYCVMSICGRSRVMEDAAIAVPAFLSLPSCAPEYTGGSAHADTFHFFGVYDGHGGSQAAEFCKEKLHGVLAEEMSVASSSSPAHLDACMQSCFRKIDGALCGGSAQGSECSLTADVGDASLRSDGREPLVPGSVGTTAVVAVVGAHHIVVGNCGDSRAVLCRASEAVPLSFDHKANRPDEVARIEAAGGHVFRWEGHRVCGVLAISRALGDGHLKPFVSGQPEVTITERADDDECLILASDGLWDVLSSSYVCNVARKAMTNWRRQQTNFRPCHPVFKHYSKEQMSSSEDVVEDSPAEVVAAMLVKLALARNSKDNISVVVVDLKRL